MRKPFRRVRRFVRRAMKGEGKGRGRRGRSRGRGARYFVACLNEEKCEDTFFGGGAAEGGAARRGGAMGDGVVHGEKTGSVLKAITAEAWTIPPETVRQGEGKGDADAHFGSTDVNNGIAYADCHELDLKPLAQTYFAALARERAMGDAEDHVRSFYELMVPPMHRFALSFDQCDGMGEAIRDNDRPDNCGNASVATRSEAIRKSEATRAARNAPPATLGDALSLDGVGLDLAETSSLVVNRSNLGNLKKEYEGGAEEEEEPKQDGELEKP